jgi:predicted PurR-regulated permease PerM
MWAVGVDFAAFWALMIFLLNFIPIIGALLGVTFPSLLALVQFETIGPFLVTSLALSGAQFVVSNLVEPRLMGRKLHLSPLVIILSLAFWGGLWGVVGMILCVPIMVILMIICGHFGPTRPIAIMLSSDGEIDLHTAATAR